MADIEFAKAAGFRLDPLLPQGAQVRQIKAALTRLGFYFPDPGVGITEKEDAQFKDALHAYQRKSTVQLGDGDYGPGSTTERILNRDLEAVDVNTLYVWRTAGKTQPRRFRNFVL